MAASSPRGSLGALLRYYRQLNGASLTEVAKALGMSVGHLSNVEAGRDKASPNIVAYYNEQFHADGLLWTVYIEEQTGSRPYQRAEQGDKPAYPIPGDAAEFEADVTPDGLVVPPNFTFEKVWRVKNTGSVPWIGRHLARIGAIAGPGIPHSPAVVLIGNTKPSETVDITVPIRAQDLPSTAQARWKMIDESGWEYFPDRYPFGLLMTVTVAEGVSPPEVSHLV